MADIRSLIAGDEEQASAVAPAARAAASPVLVRPAPTIQRTTPTAAQRAEVEANNAADLRTIAESKRQQATALAQQMAGHLQKGDTASATNLAAQIGALNREIQSIGGQPIVMPTAMPAAAPVAAPVAPMDARTLIAGDGTIAQQATPPPPLSPVAKHFMDAFNTIRSNKPAFLASTADVVANAPSAILNLIGTASGRLTGETPEKSQKIGQAISSFAANPFGRLTGTTESPQYQGLQSAVAAPFEYAANKISQVTGMNPVDASLLVGAGTMALPEATKFVAKNISEASALPTVKAEKTTTAQAEQRTAANAAAADQLRQQFAAKQAAARAAKQAQAQPAAQAAERPADFGAAYAASAEPPLFKPPVELTPDETGVYREKPPLALPGPFGEEPVAPVAAAEAQPVAAEMPSSVGAAGVTHENAVRAALAEARPDLQASLANRAPSEITPEELSAIQIHNKFAKVDPDFIPTEGQATQDIAKLSDEYNDKAKPGYEDLRKKFEERDPYLIKGFNNVKEQFAPDSTGVGQQGKANNVLEKVKTENVDVDTRNIKNAYESLKDENGKFPIDLSQVAANAFEKINAEDNMEYLPTKIKNKLEKYQQGGEANLNLFENLLSNIASEQRMAKQAGDGTTVHVLGLVRDAAEALPMKGEDAIRFKEKADIARRLFKNQKDLLDPEKPTFNKLYSLAYEDNRTPLEMATGNVAHPAAKNFFENFVIGNKTTSADLSRAIELVGKDSPAHHEIISGLVDYLKQKSGVIDDKGNVSQKTLRTELNKLGPNLDLIAGSEVANRLRNIGDVAELSEHVRNRGGGSANVSQTAITNERQASLEAVKDVGIGLAEGVANLKTGGLYGTAMSALAPVFKNRRDRAIRAAELAKQEEAAAAQRAKVTRIISPAAGIQLKDMLPPNTKD
jgi:hypothetical protein